jgi:phosphatidylglycerol:prolipoprotein diacylglycerol transferase
MLPHRHLYALAWTLGGALWVLLGVRRVALRTRGEASPPRVLALLAATALAALAGARVHCLLLAPELLQDGVLRALVLPFPDEGAALRISGGLLAALALLLGLGPRALGGTLDRAQLCDALVPLSGVAIALGRLGCLADGCCFGTPCTLPWCVRFPAPSPAYWSHVAQGLIARSAATSLPVHPLQLYLAAGGLLALLASACVERAGGRAGTAALVFVATLCLQRLLVESLRESSFGAGLRGQAALDGACTLVALGLLLRRAQRGGAFASGGAAAICSSSRPGTPSAWISRAAVPSSKRGRWCRRFQTRYDSALDRTRTG